MKRYSIRADSGVSATGANIFESSTGYWVSYADHEAALKAAVAAEREARAKVCESLPDQHGVNEDGRTWLVRTTRAEYAKAIRARGAAHDKEGI